MYIKDMLKKSTKIKDILFYLSCIPYIIFLFLGFVRCITNTVEYKFLDLYGFVEPIEIFIFSVGLISILILGIPFCYIVYYVIDKYNNEKNIDNKKINKGNIMLVIYFLSFIPYLYLVYSCIFGIEFGLMGSSYTYYGFDAIVIAFMYGCVILVYPIIIIFQIIYTIKNYKLFSNNLKNTVKIIIGLLISSIVVLSFLSSIYH